MVTPQDTNPIPSRVEKKHNDLGTLLILLTVGTLDTTCVEEIPPMDFEGKRFAPEIMGTLDYWENVAMPGKKIDGPELFFATPRRPYR